ncbi:MAG: T9SS type A sorting domain-containing protein [Bacteroidales bacterium]|nr:T9SS type A sorting domain-containing protein [Bacteroidales bacterium]
MKTTLSFITLLLLTFLTKAQTPDYLANNPQWRMSSTYGGGGYCIQFNEYFYHLDSDSIIGEITYKKLRKRGYCHSSWIGPPPVENCGTTVYYNYSYGLIRQENKKMFYKNGTLPEELLYDFDLHVGDTLPDTYGHIGYYSTVYVIGIDSMMIGDGYRKVFILDGEQVDWQNKLIEGVGFESGLLEMFPGFELGSYLDCFALNDTVYYPSYGYPCEITVNISSITAADAIHCYPNPVIDRMTIDLTFDDHINRIIVSDLLGNSVELPFRYTSEREIVVDFTTMKSGLYIVQLQNPNAISSKFKVLKQ